MRWDAVVPGQPPSVNHTYRMGRMAVQRGGRPVLRDDGSAKVITRPVMTDEAKMYRDGATLILKSAKPSRWQPDGQVRVTFDLALARDEDADNVLKLLLDALKRAIGYDDRHFLPCVRSKTTGAKPQRAYVLVTVEDVE